MTSNACPHGISGVRCDDCYADLQFAASMDKLGWSKKKKRKFFEDVAEWRALGKPSPR